MDESIQSSLLTPPVRGPRRLNSTTRPKVRAALTQVEADGKLLREMRVSAIARMVREMTGVDVADDSIRPAIIEAGLVPPPLGKARTKKATATGADVHAGYEELRDLGRLRLKIEEAKLELSNIRAALAHARDEMHTTGAFWADIKSHIRSAAAGIAKVNDGFERVDAIVKQYTGQAEQAPRG